MRNTCNSRKLGRISEGSEKGSRNFIRLRALTQVREKGAEKGTARARARGSQLSPGKRSHGMSRKRIQQRIRETLHKRFQQVGIPRNGWTAHLAHPVDPDGIAIVHPAAKEKASLRGEKGLQCF
jgi:hypothetical protein